MGMDVIRSDKILGIIQRMNQHILTEQTGCGVWGKSSFKDEIKVSDATL